MSGIDAIQVQLLGSCFLFRRTISICKQPDDQDSTDIFLKKASIMRMVDYPEKKRDVNCFCENGLCLSLQQTSLITWSNRKNSGLIK